MKRTGAKLLVGLLVVSALAACFLVELGNGDKFLFAVGSA